MTLAKVDCSWKAKPPPPPKHLCGDEPLTGYEEHRVTKRFLPTNWKPCHKSGEILKQYLASCEEKHNQVMSQLQKDAAKVNQDIEEQIRLAARIYNAEVENIQCELEKFMSCKEKSTDDMLSEIEKAWKTRCEEVEDLHKELLRLEENRAHQLRAMLQTARQGMLGAALKTPQEIDLIYTEQLYSVNNQHLCNQVGIAETRCYLLMLAGQASLDAHHKLTLAAILAEEESELSKKDESIKELPPTHVPIKRCSVGKISMGKADSTAVLALAAAFMSNHKSIRNEAFKLSSFNRDCTGSSFEVFFDSVEDFDAKCNFWDDDGNLESSGNLMLEVYQEAVSQIMEGFLRNLRKLREDIALNNINTSGQYELHESPIDLEMYIDESIKTKVGISCDHIESVHLSCKYNILTLEAMLQRAYALMYDAANLWSAHKCRRHTSRMLMELTLQRSVAAHDTEQLATETSLNVAIEQLRQSHDLVALEKHHHHVITLLNNIANMYEDHYKQEVEKLSKYVELVQATSPVLCDEVNAFMNKYPYQEYKKKVGALEKSRLGPILRPMEINIAVMLNSELSLLSSIQEKRLFLEADLKRSSVGWIQENAITLASKHNLKMRLHKSRYERIKVDIAEVRRYELEYHSARLTSHVNSVKLLVNGIGESLKKTLKFENLYPIADRLQPIIDALAEGQVKKEILESMKLRVTSYSKSFEESVAKARESWNAGIYDRLQKAIDSTYAFLSSIRLFSSGGSWAPLEAERAARELARCADSLSSAQSDLEMSGEPVVALTLLEPRHDVARVLFGVNTALTGYGNIAHDNSVSRRPKRLPVKEKK